MSSIHFKQQQVSHYKRKPSHDDCKEFGEIPNQGKSWTPESQKIEVEAKPSSYHLYQKPFSITNLLLVIDTNTNHCELIYKDTGQFVNKPIKDVQKIDVNSIPKESKSITLNDVNYWNSLGMFVQSKSQIQ